LVYRDANLLKKSFKIPPAINHPTNNPTTQNNLTNFIEKKKILPDFEKFNKRIREDDSITSDNYYDNILNECMIDAANEIIGKERIYGDSGEPLPWSSRNRVVTYKYNNTKVSKNNLRRHVEKELTEMVNYKMGLIAENHDYLDSDQLNAEREKRLMNNIIKEVNLLNNY
jgi:hypothetical protein